MVCCSTLFIKKLKFLNPLSIVVNSKWWSFSCRSCISEQNLIEYNTMHIFISGTQEDNNINTNASLKVAIRISLILNSDTQQHTLKDTILIILNQFNLLTKTVCYIWFLLKKRVDIVYENSPDLAVMIPSL